MNHVRFKLHLLRPSMAPAREITQNFHQPPEKQAVDILADSFDTCGPGLPLKRPPLCLHRRTGNSLLVLIVLAQWITLPMLDTDNGQSISKSILLVRKKRASF